MAWIDYKKACDVVPHSWIIEGLDLFGVAENIKSLLVNSMEKWKVMQCSGEVESRRQHMSFQKAKRRLIILIKGSNNVSPLQYSNLFKGNAQPIQMKFSDRLKI